METINILIVDDKPDNLRLLSDVLLKEGYIVRKAINGSMALKSIAADKPDLVLLDIQMPDMDGFEVCYRLRESPETKDLPIIFLSALDDAMPKLKAFDLGAVDYITKPFRFQEVLVRVNRQLILKKQEEELALYQKLLSEEKQRSEVLGRQLTQAMQMLQQHGITELP